MPGFWLMLYLPLKKIDSSSQDISVGGGLERRIKEERTKWRLGNMQLFVWKAGDLFKTTGRMFRQENQSNRVPLMKLLLLIRPSERNIILCVNQMSY